MNMKPNKIKKKKKNAHTFFCYIVYTQCERTKFVKCISVALNCFSLQHIARSQQNKSPIRRGEQRKKFSKLFAILFVRPHHLVLSPSNLVCLVSHTSSLVSFLFYIFILARNKNIPAESIFLSFTSKNMHGDYTIFMRFNMNTRSSSKTSKTPHRLCLVLSLYRKTRTHVHGILIKPIEKQNKVDKKPAEGKITHRRRTTEKETNKNQQ